MKITASTLIAVVACASLNGCVVTVPPVVDNDDAAPTQVIISKPNHTWSVHGAVVKLEPDANGCLVRKRIPSQSMGGSYKHIFKARPGDVVAIAMASEYSVSTKQPCSIAYLFKIEPGFKRYEMGWTGACVASGWAYPMDSGTKNGIVVKATEFAYPMEPILQVDESNECVQAPQELLDFVK